MRDRTAGRWSRGDVRSSAQDRWKPPESGARWRATGAQRRPKRASAPFRHGLIPGC